MSLEKVKRVHSQLFGELPIQAKGATFKPAGVKREEKIGDVPENSGYTESYTFAELKIKLNAFNNDNFFFELLGDAREDTLTIYTTGGKQFIMPKAWTVEPGQLGDGEIEIIYKASFSPRLK
jgi:hypothetical protein